MSKRYWPSATADRRNISGRVLWHFQCPYCDRYHAVDDDEGDTPVAACDTYKRVTLKKSESVDVTR